MKYINKITLLLITAVTLLCGCYDDEGNYSYTDINEIDIKLDKNINVRLPKGDDSTLVQIVPELSQSLLENESNLSFLWTSITEMGQKPVVFGTQKICSLYVKSNTKDFKLRLTITDASTTVNWYKEISLTMVPPFSNTYFVLQEIGGKSVLGAVDGEGSAGVVIPDVYKEETGTELPIQGKPIALVGNEKYGSTCPLPEDFYPWYGYNKKQRITAIVTDQDIMVLNAETFKNVHPQNLKDLMRCIKGYIPGPQKLLEAEDMGEMLINGGKLYWANMDGYSLFRTVTMDNSETFVAQNVGSLGRKGYVIYDSSKQRFLVCMQEGSYDYEQYYNYPIYAGATAPQDTYGPKATAVGKTDVDNVFNPNHVEGVAKMLDIICGDPSDHAYACALGTDNLLHIYRFNAGGWPASDEIARCDGYYKVDLPEGVQNGEELSFATSSPYDGIIFVAGGNKIYKLDTKRSHPKLSVIYECNNAAAKITHLKFKYTNQYGQAPYRFQLVAAIDNGSDHSIVEILLNSAGDASRDEGSIIEYSGFSKIIDFAYCFKYQYS